MKKILLVLFLLIVLAGCKKEDVPPKEVWIEVEVVGYLEKPYIIDGRQSIEYYIIVENNELEYLVNVKTGSLFFDTPYYYPLNSKVNVEKGDLIKYVS